MRFRRAGWTRTDCGRLKIAPSWTRWPASGPPASPSIPTGSSGGRGFQNDLIEAVDGFVMPDAPAVVRVWQGPGGEPTEQGTRQVVGAKLRQVRGLTENQREFLQAHAPGPVKVTIPSPSQFPAICYQPGVSDEFYPTRSDLLWEIAGFIKAEIATLLESGVDYIQIDAPRYSYYVDPQWRQHLRELGEDPDAMFEEAVAADNFCLEGARGSGATVALHVCRGNNQSKWYAQGGYEAIAERLFGTLAVDRFLLEYDTERAGTFEPLRFMPSDKMVVLGLVSSKESAIGVAGLPGGAHRRGQRVRAAGTTGAESAMRVCVNGGGQPAHRG